MSDELKSGVGLAIHATRSGDARDFVGGRWTLPDEKADPVGWLRVSEDLGFAICSTFKHGGVTSLCVDLAPDDIMGWSTTPGQAAFETWAQEQVGESGFRDSEDYWDALTKDEQAMWDRIALAARRPLDPLNRPRTRGDNSK